MPEDYSNVIYLIYLIVEYLIVIFYYYSSIYQRIDVILK